MPTPCHFLGSTVLFFMDLSTAGFPSAHETTMLYESWSQSELSFTCVSLGDETFDKSSHISSFLVFTPEGNSQKKNKITHNISLWPESLEITASSLFASEKKTTVMTVNISQLVFKHLLKEILFEMTVGTWPGFGFLNQCPQFIHSREQNGNSHFNFHFILDNVHFFLKIHEIFFSAFLRNF